MRRPILNHTKRGELVYEPFLAAAPRWPPRNSPSASAAGWNWIRNTWTVIVQRWQTLSGSTARLEGDGRSFEEIAAERHSGNAASSTGTIQIEQPNQNEGTKNYGTSRRKTKQLT